MITADRAINRPTARPPMPTKPLLLHPAAKAVLFAACLLPFAWAAWVPVAGRDLMLVAGSAVTATLGQMMVTRALSLAPVAVLQPVAFFQIIWATMATVLIFGEPVSCAVVFGAAIIVSAVAWAARREARPGK